MSETPQTAENDLLAKVRALAYSEDAHAVLFGVTGTHPDSYSGVTKDEALECAGELLTRLRSLFPSGKPTSDDVAGAVASAEAAALAAHRDGTCSDSPWTCSHCEAGDER